MSVMNLVRLAKVLALLAFVLPWAAVSCNNVDLATASGIELIQGKMTQNPDAGQQISRQMGAALSPGVSDSDVGYTPQGVTGPSPDLGVNFVGIAAVAVIVVGLGLSFAGAGRTAARNVMVTSLLGLALCFGTVWYWKEQVKSEAGRQGQTGAAASPFGGSGGMGAMGAGMIDSMLQERFGYWIALSALAVAAGAGAIGMAGGAAAVKPQGEPLA